jgi:hypothetical protein
MKKILKEWRMFLEQEEPVKRKMSFKKPPKTPAGYGSKHEPCELGGEINWNEGLGKYQFHPHDPSKPVPWECNTPIENVLLFVFQQFIGENKVKAITPQIAKYIIKYFKNKTEDELPINRITKSTPVYRGTFRGGKLTGRSQRGIAEIYQNTDWLNPSGDRQSQSAPVDVLEGKGQRNYIRFPYKGSYTPHRPVASFSFSFDSAETFASETGVERALPVIFETPANTETNGGGFFIDFKDFYGLVDNPDNPFKIGGVDGFAGEQEALLIASQPGDPLPTPWIWIPQQWAEKFSARAKKGNQE